MILSSNHSEDPAPSLISQCEGDQVQSIAIISKVSRRSSRIQLHDLNAKSKSPQLLPGTSGYTYYPSESLERTEQVACINKMISRNKASLDTLCCFNTNRGIPGDAALVSSEDREPVQPQPILVTTGRGTFVSRRQIESGKAPIIDVFTEIRMQYPNGILSKQYIHVQNSKRLRRLEHQDISSFRSVAISTGMCLFSKALVPTIDMFQGDKSTGNSVPLRSLPTHLTIYELEITTRLASTISDILGLLYNGCTNNKLDIIVNVDVPDIQYYWAAFELFQHGVVTKEYVQAWIATVDERRHKLWCFINSAICNLLSARHLPPARVILAQGTRCVREYLKQAASIGTIPSLDDLKVYLEHDEADSHRWNAFLRYAGDKNEPKDVRDLGRMFHVFNALSPVLHTTELGGDLEIRSVVEGGLPQLLLQVDDIFEWKVFDRAKRILKERQSHVPHNSKVEIVGLFPMQKIFVGGDGRSNLWTNPPGPLLRSAETGRLCFPADIFSLVYGGEMWSHIDNWIKQSGQY